MKLGRKLADEWLMDEQKVAPLCSLLAGAVALVAVERSMTTTPDGSVGQAPDAFISHSSQDKRLFVRPLIECLEEYGARVWYDEYSISVGDSLSAAIDKGLTAARMGVVVISPSFIDTAKKSGWTHYELRGIVSNSIGASGRRIVPVWLDVSLEDVRSWSPSMADLMAIDAGSKSVEEVGLEIMRVIAPERAGGLARLRALATFQATGAQTTMDPSSLIKSPALERRVPGHVPLRAMLVTEVLGDTGYSFSGDTEGFLENLSRDLHHEREMRVWEAIAVSYVSTSKVYDLDERKRKVLLNFLLRASMGSVHEPSIDILGQDVAAMAWDRYKELTPLIGGEAIIGEGGLLGFLNPAISQ